MKVVTGYSNSIMNKTITFARKLHPGAAIQPFYVFEVLAETPKASKVVGVKVDDNGQIVERSRMWFWLPNAAVDSDGWLKEWFEAQCDKHVNLYLYCAVGAGHNGDVNVPVR